MIEPEIIEQKTGDPATDIALDTIALGKQALVFVNSKRSAESAAEKIAKKTGVQKELTELSQQILKVLSSPTKQCKRLAFCIERGTAFHHSGLHAKQRELVEAAFFTGKIKIIGCTPTLAAGINLPAYRAIIRDSKRFSGGGMTAIPVLDYLQMSGRAGRPDFNDEFGESILIAKTQRDPDILEEMYIQGEPEAIWSKVAALPVLRTYCLSLVATEFVRTEKELQDFFAETFFAHQYGDTKGVNAKISETLSMLKEWGFLQKDQPDDGFVSAANLGSGDLQATTLGKRVSQLYLDPLSAHHLIKGLARARGKTPTLFSWTHLLAGTSEMRPLPRVSVKDYETLQELVVEKEFLSLEPSLYDPEYETFMQAVKAAKLFDEWANEQQEDYLLETYNVRPGELHGRLTDADWLLYCLTEIARILKQHGFIASLQKTRTRLKYGVKEELVPLLRFKGIGRVRARKLYRNGVKTAKDVTNSDIQLLVDLVGKALASSLKKQVGEKVAEIPSPQKRKGQLGLGHKQFQTKL